MREAWTNALPMAAGLCGEGHLLLSAAFLILMLSSAACTATGRDGITQRPPPAPRRIVFLADASEVALPTEEAAALSWLRSLPDLQVELRQFQDLAGPQLENVDLVWWHHSATTHLPSSSVDAIALDVVRGYLATGGDLLLTLFAVPYLVPLGLETQPPDQVAFVDGDDFGTVGRNKDRRLAGLQSFHGHPLLRRFWGGTYTATPSAGQAYAVVRYTGDNEPTEGRVWAVAKRFIRVDRATKVGLEYVGPGGGRVVAIGEGLYFADSGNHNRQQLETLVQDTLSYLGDEMPPPPPGVDIGSVGAPMATTPATAASNETVPGIEAPPTQPAVLADTTYWQPSDSTVRAFIPTPNSTPLVTTTAAVLESVTAARSGLSLSQPPITLAPFDLTAPEISVLGTQNGLVREVWTHSILAMRELRFGLRHRDGKIHWLEQQPGDASFTARPEGHSLQAVGAQPSLSAHYAVSREAPVLVVLLEVHADEPIDVVATWRADRRIIWPRSEDHLGSLELGWESGSHTVTWRDSGGHFAAFAGFGRGGSARVLGSSGTPGPGDLDRAADEALEAGEPLDGVGVGLIARFDPSVDTVLPFAMAGGILPAAELAAAQRAALADPAAVWANNATYYRDFQAQTLDLQSPDPTFDDALRWAKVGLDSLRLTTPDMGTGIAAGLAASADTTWAPARPGYSWYFGRNALWSGLAADAYGGTELTSESLRLLARYQDVDGKILHEMSPGWTIHYDAADSTPLFLIGLEHHLRTAGDLDLLRTLWPAVERAVDFLFTTDTDGDGLIENSGVGHGWIEEGDLEGVHTTMYLASIWAAALEATMRLSQWAGATELAQRCEEAAALVRRLLDTEFWNAQSRYYYYGKNADGSLKAARTVLPTVPMYFRLLEPEKVMPLLDLIASAEITTDWGVRMVERSSPNYDPGGYHAGSVWPLYTGWASLAEFTHHRPLAGYLHLASNLRIYRHWNLGTIEEGLNGDTYTPSGVTSHQGWSQAMAIIPAIEGLMGIRPDAMEDRLTIIPHLPGGWDQVVAAPVKLGDRSFKITVTRAQESTQFTVERLAGTDPVTLEIGLPVPREVLSNLDHDLTSGVSLQEIDEVTRVNPFDKEVVVTAPMTAPVAVLTFRHTPYPEVVPVGSAPEPGTTSSGLRFVSSTFEAGVLSLKVEGLAGRPYRISIETPWRITGVLGVVDPTVPAPGPGRGSIEFTIPGSGTHYQRADLRVEFRR